MNDQDSLIRADVDRGLEIVDAIAMLEKELGYIEERLQAAGLKGEQIELNDPDREGRQFIARGSAATVPVVFTADLLFGQFQVDSPIHRRIIQSLTHNGVNHFRTFFRSVRVFKSNFDSGKQFRTKAGELLGSEAPAFISACLQRDKDGIPKSKVRIEWQRAEQITVSPQITQNDTDSEGR
jgi:hypothetical protein